MDCQHAGCRCTVAEAEQYCSQHCREHGTMTEHDEHRCACGHAACQQ